ncbi:hypothetical protein HDU67_008996 [Dinochytrium kinnereticum]|nr:hypothetical protein HDU67_008996 [Dinochytrium kinnereticum]
MVGPLAASAAPAVTALHHQGNDEGNISSRTLRTPARKSMSKRNSGKEKEGGGDLSVGGDARSSASGPSPPPSESQSRASREETSHGMNSKDVLRNLVKEGPSFEWIDVAEDSGSDSTWVDPDLEPEDSPSPLGLLPLPNQQNRRAEPVIQLTLPPQPAIRNFGSSQSSNAAAAKRKQEKPMSPRVIPPAVGQKIKAPTTHAPAPSSVRKKQMPTMPIPPPKKQVPAGVPATIPAQIKQVPEAVPVPTPTQKKANGPLTPPIDFSTVRINLPEKASVAQPATVAQLGVQTSASQMPIRKIQAKGIPVAQIHPRTLVHPAQPAHYRDPASLRPKVYVHKACINCKVSHVACDVGRPCQRCVRLGKAETCVDAERKKRGRPCNATKKAAMEALAAKEAAASGINMDFLNTPHGSQEDTIAAAIDAITASAEEPSSKKLRTEEHGENDHVMATYIAHDATQTHPANSGPPESVPVAPMPPDAIDQNSESNPLLALQALESLGIPISLEDVSEEVLRQILEGGGIHSTNDVLQAIAAISTLLPHQNQEDMEFTFDTPSDDLNFGNVALTIQEALYNEQSAGANGVTESDVSAATVEEAVAAVAQAAAAIKDAMMADALATSVMIPTRKTSVSDEASWDAECPSELDPLDTAAAAAEMSASVSPNMGPTAFAEAVAAHLAAHPDSEAIAALEELCSGRCVGEGNLRDALRELQEQIGFGGGGVERGQAGVEGKSGGLEPLLVSDVLLRQLADSGLDLHSHALQ